jgi:hypothetical protein
MTKFGIFYFPKPGYPDFFSATDRPSSLPHVAS